MKFNKIPHNWGNFAATCNFCSSAQNSTARVKQWAVVIFVRTHRNIIRIWTDWQSMTVCWLTGCYTIYVLYANSPICGSPFCVEVFDPLAVHFVGQIPQCFAVGKAATFKGSVTWINFSFAIKYLILHTTWTVGVNFIMVFLLNFLLSSNLSEMQFISLTVTVFSIFFAFPLATVFKWFTLWVIKLGTLIFCCKNLPNVT